MSSLIFTGTLGAILQGPQRPDVADTAGMPTDITRDMFSAKVLQMTDIVPLQRLELVEEIQGIIAEMSELDILMQSGLGDAIRPVPVLNIDVMLDAQNNPFSELPPPYTGAVTPEIREKWNSIKTRIIALREALVKSDILYPDNSTAQPLGPVQFRCRGFAHLLAPYQQLMKHAYWIDQSFTSLSLTQ